MLLKGLDTRPAPIPVHRPVLLSFIPPVVEFTALHLTEITSSEHFLRATLIRTASSFGTLRPFFLKHSVKLITSLCKSKGCAFISASVAN